MVSIFRLGLTKKTETILTLSELLIRKNEIQHEKISMSFKMLQRFKSEGKQLEIYVPSGSNGPGLPSDLNEGG